MVKELDRVYLGTSRRQLGDDVIDIITPTPTLHDTIKNKHNKCVNSIKVGLPVLPMSRLKKKFQNREEGALEEYWTYFSGKNAQVSECLRCEKEVKEGGRPGSLAMNCWKLLAFPSTPEKLDSIKEYLSEYVERFPLTHGKWSNQLSGGRYVVVWYFVSKNDMWRSRELITKEWVELGILPIEESYYLPYQRGGDYYEPMFGHWRTWGYKYYSNLKASPTFSGLA